MENKLLLAPYSLVCRIRSSRLFLPHFLFFLSFSLPASPFRDEPDVGQPLPSGPPPHHPQRDPQLNIHGGKVSSGPTRSDRNDVTIYISLQLHGLLRLEALQLTRGRILK